MQSKQQLLLQLLRNGEGERLDYKQTITNFHKIAKTVCAFANTSGGVILIGVTDQRQLCNIDIEEEKYMMHKAAKEFCDPPVAIEFDELPDMETETIVLAAHVDESLCKPHAAIGKSGAKGIYIRIEDKTLEVDLSAMSFMIAQKQALNALQLKSYEQLLIAHLKVHGKTTLKSFMKLCQISKNMATDAIARLTLIGMIKVHELDKEVFYSL